MQYESDLTFDSATEVNDAVTTSMGGICHKTAMEAVNCATRDLAYRPIDGVCNNLQKPMYGNPNIAQIRLAPAFYENGICIMLAS